MFLIILATICEFIDSFLGMMYGTILSPVLIILGFDPQVVIPAILFSETLSGFTSAYWHHIRKNTQLSPKSKGFKIASLIGLLGIVGIILGALVGINISKIWLQTYIGLLCVVMGLLVLSNKKFKFTWKKILGLGMIGSFNKALSGGGFGPIISSGQILSGRQPKDSIGATSLSEGFVCLIAFLMWFIMGKALDWNLILSLTIGSLIGAFLGPLALTKIKSKNLLRKTVGLLSILLGVWTLLKTYLL